MRHLILLSTFLFTNLLAAQTFTEVPTILSEAITNDIKVADINGDLALDVLLLGLDQQLDPVARIYTNDGAGNFTELPDIPLEPLQSLAVVDMDNDTDKDIFVWGGQGQTGVKIYTNDGVGNFTELPNSLFEGYRVTSLNFTDIENDTDQDILFTGTPGDNFFDSETMLFVNDGSGNYSEVLDTPFEGIRGYAVFGDLNNDFYQDIVLTGRNDNGWQSTQIYFNNGMGNFIAALEEPFNWPNAAVTMAIADIDNDSNQDVIISGFNPVSGIFEARLHINDGTGTFTEQANFPIEGANSGTITAADVNNDSYVDVFVTGNVGEYPIERIAKLYMNDGTGILTELADTPFEAVYFSDVFIEDLNGDDNLDILLSGNGASDEYIIRLYLNDGNPSSIQETVDAREHVVRYFPNPLTDGPLTIEFVAQEEDSVQIELRDLLGRLFYTQNCQLHAGTNQIEVSLEDFTPGIYFIQIHGNESGTKGYQLIIN